MQEMNTDGAREAAAETAAASRRVREATAARTVYDAVPSRRPRPDCEALRRESRCGSRHRLRRDTLLLPPTRVRHWRRADGRVINGDFQSELPVFGPRFEVPVAVLPRSHAQPADERDAARRVSPSRLVARAAQVLVPGQLCC